MEKNDFKALENKSDVLSTCNYTFITFIFDRATCNKVVVALNFEKTCLV